MKNKLYNFLGIALIGIGVTIIVVTIYMKYDTNERQKQLRKSFQQSMNSLADDSTTGIKPNEVAPNEKPQSQEVKALALLIIPKINLNVAVCEGVEMDLLKYAVGHFKETAKPGENGNCVLAGHRNFTHAEFFKNLDQLNKDDDIIIRTKSYEYRYKVTEKFVVNPDRVEVLNPTKDSVITLITCTIGAKQRLIVKGKLQK
jgi:sortase A